jgi:hypothetical protein
MAHPYMRRPLRVLTGDRNQCPACDEFFNSTAAFEKHRVGTYGTGTTLHARRCLTPDEMRARGMDQNASGWWVTERMSTGDIADRDAAIENATADTRRTG